MSLLKRKPKPQPQPNQQVNSDEEKSKFRQFAYVLAWVSFLSAIGLAIVDAIKDHKPPVKDEFYK